MKTKVLPLGFLCFCFGAACIPARAQDGAVLFKTWCASCHESTSGESRAPRRETLAQLSPQQILAALEKGVMQQQGLERSRDQRRTLAEYLSGKPLGNEVSEVIPRSAYCSGGAGPIKDVAGSPAWNGWGVSVKNMRFQPAQAAGISADDVPKLKLKWAFGFPGAISASAQPVVVNGRVYVGSWTGDVYSLDAKTGCIYWSFDAGASIWNAVSIGKVNGSFVAYFGDTAANVYALDAVTGEMLWKVKVEDHPMARVTGSPTFYEGRLYVPVASREESWAVDRKYECCKFRGSLSSLDAATGKRIWKTYLISDEPHPIQKSQIGTQLWGPSGAGVWN
jgi:polyvinyl alcohol dehydrogenase (cytochrome)